MVQTRAQKAKNKDSVEITTVKEPKKKASRYNTWINETREHQHSTETRMQITRKGKKQINVDELFGIFNGLKKNKKGSQFIIRALNGQRWFTFKGYEDEDLNVQNFEEYYNNRVKDTGKFEMFSQIEIISMTPN
jgi:hypothetical protein